jgi:hypothetical protein
MAVRASELAAMVMIGDGVLGTVMPGRHATRWIMGPQEWRPMRVLAERPVLMRALSAAEAVAGIWLANRIPSERA